MKMATNQAPCNNADEDYIDMEVSCSSNFFCYSISSPPQSREFEFQMCSISHDGGPTTSPADELFYKGKLLPLHLPPRLQMVQKLLQNSNTAFDNKAEEHFEENCAIPFITVSTSITPSTKNTTTLLESCTISPSESARVSSELNPDEFLFEWSTEISGFISENSKNSWIRKLKQIKQSSLSRKLKASRAYLKSLFSKSGCSDESCAKAACNVEAENVSKGDDCINKYMKVAKKNPFGKIDNDRYKIATNSAMIKRTDKEMFEDSANIHRRSFSGAIQRSSAATKPSSSSTSSSGSSSSSSSFSFSSNGCYDLQFLKRSSSANSDIESSIEGAIAHCKQSQQLFSSRKTASEVGVCSLSASKIAASGDKERSELCRI